MFAYEYLEFIDAFRFDFKRTLFDDEITAALIADIVRNPFLGWITQFYDLSHRVPQNTVKFYFLVFGLVMRKSEKQLGDEQHHVNVRWVRQVFQSNMDLYSDFLDGLYHFIRILFKIL